MIANNRRSFTLVLLALVAAAGAAQAQQLAAWGQCGGINGCPDGQKCSDSPWPGSCSQGYTCIRQDKYYWQCKEDDTVPALRAELEKQKKPSAEKEAAAKAGLVQGPAGDWGQCGGQNGCGATDGSCGDKQWAGCPSGWGCVRQDEYYWQCKPGGQYIASPSLEQPPAEKPSPSPPPALPTKPYSQPAAGKMPEGGSKHKKGFTEQVNPAVTEQHKEKTVQNKQEQPPAGVTGSAREVPEGVTTRPAASPEATHAAKVTPETAAAAAAAAAVARSAIKSRGQPVPAPEAAPTASVPSVGKETIPKGKLPYKSATEEPAVPSKQPVEAAGKEKRAEAEAAAVPATVAELNGASGSNATAAHHLSEKATSREVKPAAAPPVNETTNAEGEKQGARPPNKPVNLELEYPGEPHASVAVEICRRMA